ncbi:MAG TPA: hypothetical protein VJI13_06210 [Candidatus Norongarragalinales archaeon]|nr:hypothetical protein [Candidatus Norongarragalinales archaeon]
MVMNMGRPRVVEVREKKKKEMQGPKKPKVVEERDYSLLIDNKSPENVLIGKRVHEKRELVDSARDKLREDMLADITPVSPPLEGDELNKRIHEDQRKRGNLGKKFRRAIGLE